MAKTKTQYVCQECGYVSPRYLGRCPNCGAWNSLIEEVKEQPSAIKQKPHMTFAGNEVKPQLIDEVSTSETPRVKTQYEEFNRVLGGGVVPGSLVLIGGDPGIGKSCCCKFPANWLKPKRYCMFQVKKVQFRSNYGLTGWVSAVITFTCIRKRIWTVFGKISKS